jgi:hypothetical protein
MVTTWHYFQEALMNLAFHDHVCYIYICIYMCEGMCSHAGVGFWLRTLHRLCRRWPLLLCSPRKGAKVHLILSCLHLFMHNTHLGLLRCTTGLLNFALYLFKLETKWDWAILTHENGRCDGYKNSVLWSEIEKCTQFFERFEFWTFGLFKWT